ncbi:uncharacterized protein C8A04DRAFT_26417 [Dichotomopilus funicola]|uniref:DUF7728 domain-containing protein n=1 Tax=Dichotomopilus funicola TaxID=1934379 RepID=A0AAN6V792_9PEZI|nr:hypothetical protein C8A04DRAFT_26417 [Dichotomopilus funicola]
MLLKPLTFAAGLSALPAARAFLIPPEVSNADIQIANTIPDVGSQVAETQVVDVECPGCPILLTSRLGMSRQIKIDRPSHLELAFSIDHQPGQDRLLLNGFELYPVTDVLHTALTAPQVVERGQEGGEEPKLEGVKKHRRITPQPQKLGFAIRTSPPQKDAEGQFELVEVDMQIIQVGPAFIDDIPSIKVKLIKDHEGRLLMSQIDKTEANEFAKAIGSSRKEFASAISRWLALAREKVKGFKGLKGFGHCHKTAAKPAHLVEAPHAHATHDANWRANYEQHRWSKLFKHMASHILLPVLIGIVAGVSASLIGMVVGTVVVSVWRFFFRRNSSTHGRRRRHSLRKAARQEAAYSDEKAGLMNYQDEPPAYQQSEEETLIETAKI